jgi:MFS family permease
VLLQKQRLLVLLVFSDKSCHFPSCFFAIYGINAQYFALFGFAAFSNEIMQKSLISHVETSLMSGIISLVAGILGPITGIFSDAYGRSSPSLVVACLVSMVGFAILAVASGGSVVPVWVASMLFALQYGFGDTVVYISIQFIVGASRAGIGYRVYGIFGNLIATVIPIAGGALAERGNNQVLWYFTGLMASGVICWLVVWLLEGPRSLLEFPA